MSNLTRPGLVKLMEKEVKVNSDAELLILPEFVFLHVVSMKPQSPLLGFHTIGQRHPVQNTPVFKHDGNSIMLRRCFYSKQKFRTNEQPWKKKKKAAKYLTHQTEAFLFLKNTKSRLWTLRWFVVDRKHKGNLRRRIVLKGTVVFLRASSNRSSSESRTCRNSQRADWTLCGVICSRLNP